MQISDSTEVSTEISEDFGKKLKLNVPNETQAPEPEQEELGENEEEFSFACASPDPFPVLADDAFLNGQIRPIFPVFDQSLLYGVDVKTDSKQSLRPPLRKLFVEGRSEPEEEEEPAGPFCEWSSSSSGGNKTVKEASPEACKKSNSTGFSKLWRFRDLVLRSKSDGKDAFVFLNNKNYNTCESEKAEKSISEKPTGTKTTPDQKTSKGEKEKVVKVTGVNKRVKIETVSSVYEKYYVSNRRMMREGNKRRPYAPYKQDLVGFFTNVNGFSKNVHPF